MTEEGIKVMEKVLGVSWADLHVPGMVSMSTGTPFIKEMHPAISLFQHFSHVYGSYLGPEVVLPTSLNNTLHHKVYFFFLILPSFLRIQECVEKTFEIFFFKKKNKDKRWIKYLIQRNRSN